MKTPNVQPAFAQGYGAIGVQRNSIAMW